MSKATTDVLAERQRQTNGEGWTEEHDDMQSNGGLAAAAACYALNACALLENEFWRGERLSAASRLWPWDDEWWKPKTPRCDLVRAAALLIAEIERLDRLAAIAAKEKS
jgi:hypothetical protein